MHWTEIVTIILVSSFLLAMLAMAIMKVKRGESLESCACFHAKKRGKRKTNPLVEAYHSQYKK